MRFLIVNKSIVLVFVSVFLLMSCSGGTEVPNISGSFQSDTADYEDEYRLD